MERWKDMERKRFHRMHACLIGEWILFFKLERSLYLALWMRSLLSQGSSYADGGTLPL